MKDQNQQSTRDQPNGRARSGALVTLCAAAVCGQSVLASPDAASSTRNVEPILVDRVMARLVSSGSLRGSDIRVSAAKDAVILDGSVAEESAISRAERNARRVPGIENVVNRLNVDARRQQTALRRCQRRTDLTNS